MERAPYPPMERAPYPPPWCALRTPPPMWSALHTPPCGARTIVRSKSAILGEIAYREPRTPKWGGGQLEASKPSHPTEY